MAMHGPLLLVIPAVILLAAYGFFHFLSTI
jgi:hypothetical protein